MLDGRFANLLPVNFVKTQTRQVSPLSLRAAFTPGSVNIEKRTVELVWTTGAKVLRSSWFDGQFWEELSIDPAHVRMGRLNNGAPFLADHNSYNVARTLGVVESARLQNGKGTATVRFAKAEDDPEADKVFRKIVDGIIQNVSVGYRTYKVEKLEDVEQKIPTLRAIDWEPYEISAVSMGADDGAGFRSAEAPTNEVIIVSPKERTMDEAEKKRLEAEALAKRQAEETQKREGEIKEQAIKLERERTSGIRSAVKAARLGEDVAEKLINDGTAVDKARTFVLEELAKRDSEVKTEQHVTTSTGDTDADKFARMAVALLVTGSSAVRQAVQEKKAGFEKLDLDPGTLRGFSLVDLARETLERQGVKTRGMDRLTMVGRAFVTRAGPYAGVADFPVLLENTMGKILMAAYQTTPDTWSRICKTESVDDFRASPRYRAGSIGVLDSLNENGEFKNKSIPDGVKLSISTATKGNIIAISRQLIINDDMSALADLAAKLGRAARLSIEVDFYALLALNGGLGPTVGANPFFHSTNGNVNAAASAVSVAGFDADRVIMAAQKDAQNNEFLDIRPEVLLISSGQLAAARVVNNSAYDHDGTKLQRPNPVQGLFRDIVDTPRFSGTRRYLFANPSVAPAFVVAFLQGQQSPVIESEQGWRADGTEMKVRFDYLVQPFDVKGALTNAGA